MSSSNFSFESNSAGAKGILPVVRISKIVPPILNDEIKAHQQLLAKMKRQTELLAEKIKESQQPSLMSQMQEPPPPHY